MNLYQQVMQYAVQNAPHAVRTVYRHPDGTLRVFRYTDNKYMGLCEFDFPNAPPITDELLEKIRTD